MKLLSCENPIGRKEYRKFIKIVPRKELALEAFLKLGYAVIPKDDLQLSPTDWKKLECCVTSRKHFNRIFNTLYDNEEGQDDGLRAQSGIIGNKQIVEILQRLTNIIAPGHSVSKPLILISYPGCKEQKKHRDHTVASQKSHNLRAGVIVSVQENTKVVCNPSSNRPTK
jgi:hypothetical protein